MSDISAAECQKRIEQFSEITRTDEALAQFYLQDRDWNVEASITAFFAENSINLNDENTSENILESHNVQSSKRVKIENKQCLPEKFSFVSWNIDGISDRNLKERTMAVIQLIKARQVDIIFLQEVVPNSYDILQSQLSSEYLITEKKSTSHSALKVYFTVILIKKEILTLESITVKPFSNSLMMRDLTIADVRFINGIKLLLINSHLESGKEFEVPRMEQMKQAFDIVRKTDGDCSIIFAGDLNTRDSEVEKLEIPNNMQDLWISQGKRKECQYTWDTMRNSNTEIASRFKPRCRFDRVYFRTSAKKEIVPEHFGLCGIEKISGMQCFPSDHWGIYCIFDVKKDVLK